MNAANIAATASTRAATMSKPQSSCGIAQSMLEEFEQELEKTRTFLERVPQDKLSWRPHEKSMSIGQLAYHIAEVPRGVLAMAMKKEASPPDMNNRPEPRSTQEVLDLLGQSASFVRQTLSAVDDDQMLATFRIVIGDRLLMSPRRDRFLRSIMLNHWYHHRGQLGVYLRLLGVSVPPSYGPSGDESPF